MVPSPEPEIWRHDGLEVVLGPDSIRLPAGLASWTGKDIGFHELRRLGQSVDGRKLVLSTANQTYTIEARHLGGQAVLDELIEALVRRMQAHPDAASFQATLQQLDGLEHQFRARAPWVTYAFTAFCVAMFVVQAAWGAAALPFTETSVRDMITRQLLLGANAPVLVWQGEYFRLATSNFLHANLLHIGANSLMLVALGSLVERIAGPWRLSIVFLVSCLGGAFFSAWFALADLSLGASTGVVGLLGAYALVWLRFRNDLPPAFSIPLSSWITLIVVNAVLWTAMPGIDHAAHLGGALAGAATVAVLFPPARRRPDFTATTGPGIRALAVGLAAVFVAGAIWAATTAAGRPADEAAERVMEARFPGRAANRNAWEKVRAPGVGTAPRVGTPDESSPAAVLARQADTAYRQGDYARAVENGFAAVIEDPRPERRRRLATYLQAKLRIEQARPADAEPGEDSTQLRSGDFLDPATVGLTVRDGQLELTGIEGRPRLTVVALVWRRRQLMGILWIQYRDVTATTLSLDTSQSEVETLRHPGTRLEVGLIATDRVTNENANPLLKFVTMRP